tara:strand:- start:87 stop:557 length:471 start_codon:yes stop_codon:yes gene_type:complete
MELSRIISIAGKPGLSKIVSQSRTGIIVESLVDGKRFPVMGTERISALEDISIYTYEEDVLLSEVFQKMSSHFKGGKATSHKESANKLKESFKEVLPNFDEDRVYNSDIKKVYQWYNLLLDKGLLETKVREENEKADKKKAPTKKKAKEQSKDEEE